MTTPQPDTSILINAKNFLPDLQSDNISIKDIKSGLKPLSNPSFNALPDESQRLTAIHFQSKVHRKNEVYSHGNSVAASNASSPRNIIPRYKLPSIVNAADSQSNFVRLSQDSVKGRIFKVQPVKSRQDRIHARVQLND